MPVFRSAAALASIALSFSTLVIACGDEKPPTPYSYGGPTTTGTGGAGGEGIGGEASGGEAAGGDGGASTTSAGGGGGSTTSAGGGGASTTSAGGAEGGGGSAPACDNGVIDGDETDVDCGGSCAPCSNGQTCGGNGDCLSQTCVANVCAAPSCNDQLLNGDESDVDCGGSCPACANGGSCGLNADCVSMFCDAGSCADSCGNGLHDGTESDVDCGGLCAACANNFDCNSAADCISQSCINGKCAIPTCTDGVQNGSETDVDCGGATCGPCAPFQSCTAPSHCTSKVCVMNVCQPPVCNDGVENGNETDIDCGGSCPADCTFGQGCNGAGDCIGGNCQGGVCACPTGMVIVPTAGGGSYCIDRTETTYKQYLTFYNANPPTALQIPECQWNTNYTPSVGWPPVNDTLPVVGVNWCEAYAYCSYVGKRLCGAVTGGDNPYGDYAVAASSQWFNACTAQGGFDYPYGSTYSATTCNGLDAGNGGTVPVQTMQGQPITTTTCVGGVPLLYHMSGNVREWEDSCDAGLGSSDMCRARGGSFTSDALGLMCGAPAAEQRDFTAADLGFRCCLGG